MTIQLRPESQPAAWEHLDDTQTEAFRAIVTLIGEAVDGLPERSAPADHLAGLTAWLSPSRAARTVFVTGGRGSGKTTLLASIIQTTLMESKQTPKTTDAEFLRCVDLMRRRVVWLEPMDMEPMPLAANLLTAILARIEDSARRLGVMSAGGEEKDYRPRGLLDVGADYHDAVLQLQRLQTDSALAWESNLKSREGQLDPDSYAVEVLRGERARLSLNRKLEAALDALAQSFRGTGIRSPLFLLPIDDVDLNPFACLDLLKLLRMISVPRLFTLLLGDVQVADVVLNLKLSNDLARVFVDVRQPDLLALHPITVGTMAGEIAANALRKLLPPSQRVVLEPMTIVEGLNFRPLGHAETDPRLHELLAGCPVLPAGKLPVIPQPDPGAVAPWISLRDLLLVDSLQLFGGGYRPKPKAGLLKKPALELTAYDAVRFFQTTPRRLADTWLVLQKIVASCSRQSSESTSGTETRFDLVTFGQREVVRFFAQLAKSSLAGDPTLLPEERRSAAEGIYRTPTGDWRLRHLPLRAVWDEDAASPHELLAGQPFHPYRARLLPVTSTGMHFEVDAGRPGLEEAERPTIPRIPASTVGVELTILHDLLALPPESSFASPLIAAPQMTGSGWMATEWRDGEGRVASLPWPRPPLYTFWELDLFLKSWSDALGQSWVTDPSRGVELLAFVWLFGGTVLLDRAPFAPPTSIMPTPPWPDLIARLTALVNDARNRHHPRSKIAKEWLVCIPLLLMPESQLPREVERAFADAGEITSFWLQEEHETIVRLRAQRLAELVLNELDGLVSRLMKAKGFGDAYKPDMDLIYRFAGREPESPRPPPKKRASRRKP